MKFGLRTPSLKRSVRARTTGRAKRAIKKAIIPGYGKKELVGSRILRRLCTTRYITRHPLVFGISLSRSGKCQVGTIGTMTESVIGKMPS